jgi:hypothetical protein
MSKPKHNVVSYSKFDISRLRFSDITSNERSITQDIGYITYDCPKNGERQFSLQSPEIKIDSGGIPNEDSPYHKSESSRGYCKIVLEPNPNVKGESEEQRSTRGSKQLKFKNVLESIDQYCEENAEKILGSAKLAKKMKYQPIVRKQAEKEEDSDSDSDEDEGSENKEEVIQKHNPAYMKAKIPLVWEAETVDSKNFQVYCVNKEEGTHDLIDDIVSLNDLRKHIGYMRDVKFVLHACKVWASKNPSNGQTHRMWGITFKLRRVEVKPYEPTGNDADSGDDEELFNNSDDESEEQVVKKFVEAENEDSDEESAKEEEDDDEEVVIEKKKPARGRGKGKAKAEV